jgi:hypothetical protein
MRFGSFEGFPEAAVHMGGGEDQNLGRDKAMHALQKARMTSALAAGAITCMVSLSAEATGTCSEETRSALAPFVGDWSFSSEHDGVVGAPPSSGIGTLTIDDCGFVSGLQLTAVTAEEFHAELEASVSGQFLPFVNNQNIILGPITFTIERIQVNPPGPVDLTGGSATQETACVGMLKTGGRFLEARCVETEDETVEEDIFPQPTLVEVVLKRTERRPVLEPSP